MPRPIPPDMPAGMPLPPVSTPSHGAGGYFTVACSSHVAASPRTCLDVILDADQYPQWNRFCRKCTIEGPGNGEPPRLAAGTEFIFDVHMDSETADSSGRDTALVVSILEPVDEPGGDGGTETGDAAPRKGWRIAWKTRNMPGWILRSERVQEFIEVGSPGETKTEYLCWETFYGLLAPVVKIMVGSQIVRGFQVWSDDLRKKAEIMESGM